MRHKNYLYVTLILGLFFVTIYSCQTDDYSFESEIKHSDGSLPFDFESFSLNGTTLPQHSTAVASKINRLNNTLLRKTTNQSYIKVDTSYVKVLQSQDFTTYVFRVKDSTLLDDEAKNYLLIRLKDSLWHQYMVKYKFDQDQNIDTNATIIKPIYGDDFLSQVSYKCGSSNISSVWVDGVVTETLCTAGGRHTVADGSICDAWRDNDTSRMASITFVAGHWTTVITEQTPCFEDIGSGRTSGGGPNASGTDGGISDNPADADPSDSDGVGDGSSDPLTIAVGFVPNLEPTSRKLNADCISLNNFMGKSDITPGKTNEQVLTTSLIRHAQDNNFETGYSIVETSTNSGATQLQYNELTGIPNTNELYTPNATSNGDIVGLIHTHWGDDSNGSAFLSSMFSFDDFDYFARIALNRKRSGRSLNALTFIVVSHNGDIYALKPGDVQKLEEFLNDHYADNPRIKDRKKANKDFDEKIAEARNQKKREKKFLELLSGSDVKLYEYNTGDDNWEQVVDDSSNNDRKPC